MVKFHQFLTQLSAHHTKVAGYYPFTFLFIFRYGVQDFVILSPATDIEAILSESKVKLLLSSVSIALSEAGW